MAETKALEPGDPYEVANQLAGYVGPDTQDDLAAFLLRESAEAGKLADALTAAQAEIERLNGEVRRWRENHEGVVASKRTAEQYRDQFKAELATLRARNAELVEGLRPFARIADMEERAEPLTSVMVNVDLCRRARTLITEKPDGK